MRENPQPAADNVPEVTVEQIQEMVRIHRAATHTLFARLEERAKAGELTGEEFRLVAANIAARTIFTLSEILAGCTNATLDLSYDRIAHSISTAADEGGHGRPERVHPRLMMRSLNNHTVKAFNAREIDLKPIYFAIQGRYLAFELQEYLFLEGSDWNMERRRELFFFQEKFLRLQTLAAEVLGKTPDPTIEDFEECIGLFDALLDSEKVTPETVEYCDHQLRLLQNPEPGYIAGVTFAHEHRADELFKGAYALTSANRDRYTDDSWSITYDWMREHGDYAGELPTALKGVEAVHAEREEAKLRALDPRHLPAALRGAKDFSDRNANVMDGIERRIFQDAPAAD